MSNSTNLFNERIVFIENTTIFFTFRKIIQVSNCSKIFEQVSVMLNYCKI